MKTAAFLTVFALTSLPALAQSTAFTYQGELRSAGNPASGTFDMRFKLFDAAAGGTQAGSTQCVNNVAVSAGKFTTFIDVGQQFATSTPRYLEIEVRQDSGLTCATTTGYTILSPRQLLTAAPRASVSDIAHSLAIPNGSSVLVNLTNSGNVGVGTSAPASQLHLNGVQDALRITAPGPKIDLVDTSTANSRFQLQNSQGRYFMTSESFLSGSNSGGFAMIDPQGRLGLGVFDPAAPLDVAGRIQLRGPSGVFNSAGVYLASPLSSPTVRAFMGLLDDTHIGLWGATSGWSFTMDTISGNVGIGTSTPAAKLDVRGSIRLGNTGQDYAPASEENLRIVRGTISSGGLTMEGSGFTPTQQSTGHYHIQFTVPFASPPSVTLSVVTNGDESSFQAEIRNNITPTGFDLITSRSNTGDYHSMQFTMIAIGPR
ncbi:MAG: H-type lectin domain-containing protein [Phycisphaerales bacterium]